MLEKVLSQAEKNFENHVERLQRRDGSVHDRDLPWRDSDDRDELDRVRPASRAMELFPG